MGRPPHGGRGLKSEHFLAGQERWSRPPHGGRGLKFAIDRRPVHQGVVVLHTEDVD